MQANQNKQANLSAFVPSFRKFWGIFGLAQTLISEYSKEIRSDSGLQKTILCIPTLNEKSFWQKFLSFAAGIITNYGIRRARLR